MMGWTEQDIETLIAMWGASKTAQQIADVLPGKSRSAVIGKIDRMKLNAQFPDIERKRGQKKQVSNKVAPPKAKPKKIEVPDSVVAPAAMEERMCLYAYGHPGEKGFGFCGETVSGRNSYCDRHRAVVSAKPPKQKVDA